MLKMSFYNGTLDRNVLLETIKNTDKKILFTFGFTWKNPTVCKLPISVDEAIRTVNEEAFLDATEYDDYIHLNAFGVNDLW